MEGQPTEMEAATAEAQIMGEGSKGRQELGDEGGMEG